MQGSQAAGNFGAGNFGAGNIRLVAGAFLEGVECEKN